MSRSAPHAFGEGYERVGKFGIIPFRPYSVRYMAHDDESVRRGLSAGAHRRSFVGQLLHDRLGQAARVHIQQSGRRLQKKSVRLCRVSHGDAEKQAAMNRQNARCPPRRTGKRRPAKAALFCTVFPTQTLQHFVGLIRGPRNNFRRKFCGVKSGVPGRKSLIFGWG